MGWVVKATPRPLYPLERSSTHCIGCRVGPRAGLDGCGKSRPPPGFDSRTAQPVASRYTDRAIPAPENMQHSSLFLVNSCYGKAALCYVIRTLPVLVQEKRMHTLKTVNSSGMYTRVNIFLSNVRNNVTLLSCSCPLPTSSSPMRS